MPDAPRWLNQLRPNVQTGSFTPDEDEFIIAQQRQLGNRWTTIASMLPGRTDNAVKNRWNSALRKRVDGSLSHQGQSSRAEQQQQQQQPQPRQQQPQPQQQQQHATEAQLGEELHAQQEVLQQLLASAASKAKDGAPAAGGAHASTAHRDALLAAAMAATHSGVRLPTSLQQLLARSLAGSASASVSASAGGSASSMLTSSRLLPTPPPSSTPLVATAPPFQLPMPAMTLQPQMSPDEAAAALASARCEVFKKVGHLGAQGWASPLHHAYNSHAQSRHKRKAVPG